MRSKLFLLLFLLSTAVLADDERDGLYWRDLDNAQKTWWALGWLDGLASGQRLANEINSEDRYATAVHKFGSLKAGTLVQGLDEFFNVDYRNLHIDLREAAYAVALYGTGAEKAYVARYVEKLRAEHSH